MKLAIVTKNCFSLEMAVSSRNATEKTLIYEMPLIFVFGSLSFGGSFFILGLGLWHFVDAFMSRDRNCSTFVSYLKVFAAGEIFVLISHDKF